MSLENTIKTVLESNYPGYGQSREAAPAPQGSSNPNPAKQDAVKGPGVDAARGTASSTLAPHAAGGDKAPAAQGSSNPNPEKQELDKDAPGVTASKLAKKAPSLVGKSGKPKLHDVEDGVDPSVVINQPNSKGNVHVESVEDDDMLSEEEYELLSDEEKSQYELVELDLETDELDEELEELLDEEMTEEEVLEFIDLLNDDEEIVEFFETMDSDLMENEDKEALEKVKLAMANRKSGKGIGMPYDELRTAANKLDPKNLDKALGRADTSKGKSGMWKPEAAGATKKGVMKTGSSSGSSRSAMGARLAAKYPKIDVGESNIQTIFGENTELSEDFMNRASTVFEAVVSAKVTEMKEEIEELATEALHEAMDEYRAELAEQIDGYITYMAQHWMEENKLAVVEELRTEVAEDFMQGLKNLFLENYVAIPEDKTDVFEELQQEVADLREAVNEKIAEAVELSHEITELKKVQILMDVTEGMAETEVEKFLSLAENLSFENEGMFTQKVTAIKESYFPRKGRKTAENITPETLHEGASSSEDVVELSPIMQKYIAGLGSTRFSK
jgi:hypothetical protein